MKQISFSTKNRYSLIVLIVMILVISILRILTLKSNELSWDVFGYYLHLPATFIYHDHALNSVQWIRDLMDKYPLTQSLYQISTGPDGNPVFFFLMGMSFFYAPWFFTGHLLALALGYPADGFSLPYQYSMALGAVVYTVIGLIYFRKLLLAFFSDGTAAMVLLIVVLGTNYLHFMTVKNLETANILFLMVVLIAWNTKRWHEEKKLKFLIAIAVFSVLMALAKPSEVLAVLIPLLWGVYNRETLKKRLTEFVTYKWFYLIAAVTALLIALPQMLYWYSETGHFIYDSYKNPGVGLDLNSPHIINVLFSFRKGWLVYTPVMLFSLLGFRQLYRQNKPVFWPILIYSLAAFYILSSWTEWWYGASYSIRPMITLYPLLGITLGYFIQSAFRKKAWLRGGFSILVLMLIALNLFQMWQLNHYILDPYRMTKKYYFAIFGKTHISDADRSLMAPDLTFNDGGKLTNEQNYNRRNIGYYTFDDPFAGMESYFVSDSSHGYILRLDSTLAFSPEIRTTFRGLTSKAYAWVRAGVDVLIPKGYHEDLPLLVMTFDRREGSYYYHSFGPDTALYKPGTWAHIEADVITPNVRSRDDFFRIYVWSRGKQPVYIDNLKADVYEPKW